MVEDKKSQDGILYENRNDHTSLVVFYIQEVMYC